MTGDRRNQDRRSGDPRVNDLVTEVAGIKQHQAEIAAQLALNTAITSEVSKNTADIIEVWHSVKGGMRVLGWLGVGAKWLAIIAGCITAVSAAVYAIVHFGGPKP